MGGFDDNVAIMGDWMPPSPNPIPGAFYLSMMKDESESGNGTFLMPDHQENAHQTEAEAEAEAEEMNKNINVLGEGKLGSRGGLMERIAARAGFNAPRLSIRPPNDLSKKPELPSPYLTIPPGLSPTTLLDSPVFLSNSLALPSPTTGKFLFGLSASGDHHKGKENNFEDMNASSFAFKPITESASSLQVPKTHLSNNSASASLGSNQVVQQTHNSAGTVEHSPSFDEQIDDGDQRSSGDPNGNGGGSTAEEDGYNWRKYGQKHVKGSEYPRSYYKCTHPNCPVKKKVERSHEGHITEIIYKGAHNHQKPPPNRRSNLGSSSALMPLDGDPIWSSMQNGNAGVWKSENLEGQDYSNGGTTALQAQNGSAFESAEGVDRSSTFSNDEEEDDRGTHGSVSLGYDGEGDESESKRRRIEAYAPEMSGASRPIREPRVVVQTTSEVDILDDGYRWRKYGQKVVKGNPNPRSYYKCTSAGCNVRKHVERASHDLKSVITTYEGKHNHDVPAARNSGGHTNSGGQNAQQQAHAAPSNVHRPEPSHLRGSPAWYENPFGLPPGRPQLGPGHGFGYGMNQAGLGLVGIGPQIGQQTRPVNNTGYMVPKGEPKLEPVTDAGLNSSNGSSLYQQLMSRLPM